MAVLGLFVDKLLQNDLDRGSAVHTLIGCSGPKTWSKTFYWLITDSIHEPNIAITLFLVHLTL